MKAIYEMNFDCGRNGSLSGKFVAEKEYVDYMVANEVEVCFGEVLGKHSDVSGPVSKGEIKMISDEPTIVAMFEDHNFESGYNPLDEEMAYDEDYEDYSVWDYIHEQLTGKKPKWAKQ